MAYSTSNTTNVSFTDTSLSTTLSTKAKEVVLSATEDCYISFDSTTVTATNGFYITADKQYIFHILYPAFITAMRVSASGVLSVMELGDSVIGLGVTYTDTFSGDANLLREDVIVTFNGDANLTRENVSLTFTGDANLKIEVSTSITGDANLLIENISATATGDANLLKVVSAEATGDANLVGEVANSYTGDASLLSVEANTCSGDANLLIEVSEDFTSDCLLLVAGTTRILGTFTGDTNLLREDIILTFSGDANMDWVVSGLAFCSDAKLVTI